MRQLIWNYTHAILSASSGPTFCRLYNSFNRFNRNKLQCTFEQGTYLLRDQERSIHISRPGRYRYYGSGIGRRLKALFNDYTGGLPDIAEGDLVIDCGANIGEFSLHCLSLGARCVAFEPDPTEYRALEKNCGKVAEVYPKALWYEETRLAFNLQNETGDSSAVEGEGGSDFMVDAIRLDSVETLKNAERIKLLKLEAEGFEEEVLRGATGLLSRIEFIAADLGPERGPESRATLPEVTNTLVKHGFSILHYNPARSILLFRNDTLA